MIGSVNAASVLAEVVAMVVVIAQATAALTRRKTFTKPRVICWPIKIQTNSEMQSQMMMPVICDPSGDLAKMITIARP